VNDSNDIGKIQRVPLREVWKNEATDFTTWLQVNIEVISEAVDIELGSVEREQSAGAFSVDLVAEDTSGNVVVIENQLEKSNHDHLGKLITYLVAMEARSAIWIVSEPRPEHVAAITWLNEASSANFYLLKLEAIQIGTSSPAPLLTLIVGPSEEGKEVGRTKKNIAERYLIRQRFWGQLLERSKQKTQLHASITPSQYGWISAGAGRQGLGFNYSIRKEDAQVELYIDRGKEKEDENKLVFEELVENREKIEQAFGGPLEWQSLEGKRACRIRKTITIGGYRSDEENWAKIHDAMIDAMIKLEKALSPFVAKLGL